MATPPTSTNAHENPRPEPAWRHASRWLAASAALLLCGCDPSGEQATVSSAQDFLQMLMHAKPAAMESRQLLASAPVKDADQPPVPTSRMPLLADSSSYHQLSDPTTDFETKWLRDHAAADKTGKADKKKDSPDSDSFSDDDSLSRRRHRSDYDDGYHDGYANGYSDGSYRGGGYSSTYNNVVIVQRGRSYGGGYASAPRVAPLPVRAPVRNFNRAPVVSARR